MSYIQLTTPLVLHADPVLPGHAVTKRYVDGKKAFLQASWFTSGVVNALRMPALSGDVSSVAGSGVTALSNSGVVAGSYTKVTVNSSGRVTGGGYLAAVDVPSVDWSKVTTGKPTTAAGYGITNLIALSGGTANGHIASSATATDNLHAVTKAYVDDNVTGVVSASLSVGDVVRKTTSVTPSGFLRCNGGEVSKTTYAALYSVIGDKYTPAILNPGMGRPCSYLSMVNADANDIVVSYSDFYNIPYAYNFSSVAAAHITTKNKIYSFGSHRQYSDDPGAKHLCVFNLNASSGGVLSHSLSDLGTNSNFLSVQNGWVDKDSIVVAKNKAFIYTTNNTIWRADIDINGNISDFYNYKTANTPNPVGGLSIRMFLSKNRLYLARSYTVYGTNSSNKYQTLLTHCAIDENGDLGSWTHEDLAFLEEKGEGYWFLLKDKLYYTGGTNGWVVYGGSHYLYNELRAIHRVLTDNDGIITGFSDSLGSNPYSHSSPNGAGGSVSYLSINDTVLCLAAGTNNNKGYRLYKNRIDSSGKFGSWSTLFNMSNYGWGLGEYMWHSFTKAGLLIATSGTAYSGFMNVTRFTLSSTFSPSTDFSAYYSGANDPSYTASSNFRLPDLATQEKDGINFYIKY